MDAAGTSHMVLPLEEARRIVEEQASSLVAARSETVPLLDSPGRVLAEEICADRDFPPFPRSTRDGYAVRAADVHGVPVELKVVDEVRAGDFRNVTVAAGEAVEIMTGAPVPVGADAVVMVEYTAREGDRVAIQRAVAPGENVVAQGAEARAGDVLLARGYRMNHAGVAIAAAVGKAGVQVYARPKVAIVATGDELVAITESPAAGQIRNSNTYSLAVQVQNAGGDPVLLPPARDDVVRLRESLIQAFEADLVLISGGVSMGKYDLVEQVLADFGARFFFTGALIQPGKPVVFGHARNRYFLGLPGNPVSTMVTFELFARPLLDGLSGTSAGTLRYVRARLKADIQVKTGLTRFLPALLTGEYHDPMVELLSWKGSGDIATAARANCYVVVPRNRDHIFADEWVDVMM